MTVVPQTYSKYELLFTPRLIPVLRNLRGKRWQRLVDALCELPEMHPDVLAFSMMMISLDNCLGCEMDSYRAQRGCVTCARHTIDKFKGTDDQLLMYFEEVRRDVLQTLVLPHSK